MRSEAHQLSGFSQLADLGRGSQQKRRTSDALRSPSPSGTGMPSLRTTIRALQACGAFQAQAFAAATDTRVGRVAMHHASRGPSTRHIAPSAVRGSLQQGGGIGLGGPQCMHKVQGPLSGPVPAPLAPVQAPEPRKQGGAGRPACSRVPGRLPTPTRMPARRWRISGLRATNSVLRPPAAHFSFAPGTRHLLPAAPPHKMVAAALSSARAGLARPAATRAARSQVRLSQEPDRAQCGRMAGLAAALGRRWGRGPRWSLAGHTCSVRGS